jgi:MoxR-like ATPase
MSRAEFARRVGVSAVTIYRWELPDDAAEARRPRRSLRNRLHELAQELEVERRDEQLARTRLESAPLLPTSASAVASSAAASTTPFASSAPLGSTARFNSGGSSLEGAAFGARDLLTDDVGKNEFRALERQVLEQLFSARWDQAESVLMHILATPKSGEEERVLAQLGLAMVQVLGRNDARGAFSSLLPVLARATALPTAKAAYRAYAVASLVFSVADGRLFDPGRVRGHAALAERLPTKASDADTRVLVATGLLQSAMALGDVDSFGRRIGRMMGDLRQARQPVPRCMAGLMQAHAARFEGRLSDAISRYAQVVDVARESGFIAAEVGALAYLAQSKLDGAEIAAEAESLCERARSASMGARLASGMQDQLVSAVLAECRVRAGKLAAARDLLVSELSGERFSWPPSELVYGAIRAFGTDVELLQMLKSALARWQGSSVESSSREASRLVDGLLELANGEYATATLTFEVLARATRRGCARPWVTLYAHDLWYMAALLGRDVGAAESAWRHAERMQELLPSAWHGALLRWIRGVELLLADKDAEAVQQLETARATFQLARDQPMLARTQHALLIVAYRAGRATAAEVHESEEALDDKRCALPGLLSLDRIKASTDNGKGLREQMSEELPSALALSVPVSRLSMRGASQHAIMQELISVVSELCTQSVWLEELDASGRPTRMLAGRRATGAASRFEFGDGAGRRLNLGVGRELRAALSSMVRTVVTVASLALEVASLRSRAEPVALTEEIDHEDFEPIEGVVAESAAMRALLQDVRRFADSDATVLITGESGVGKEVIARAIHSASERGSRPFVTFNCSAVPHGLFEGQLFGHRKGAFTGATEAHSGVVRAAHGGTLFLDEIGDLPLDLQPKLLRFLENGEVLPLGATSPQRVDVRVIAATNRELAEMIRQGEFREDLFYRLQVVTLFIAPLRERKEDIIALIRAFMQDLIPEGTATPRISQDAMEALLAHRWPGNAREVRNVVARAVAFSPLPKVLTTEHLRV